MRVLYVSHTAEVSGGERALLELLSGLPADVEAWAAAPEGALSRVLLACGHRWIPLPGTTGSLRLHPVRTARGLAELGRAGVAIRRAAQARHVDLVHANSSRAGLSGVVARVLGAPPLVVHEHDVLPTGATAGLVLRLVGTAAATVLANSEHTARRLARDAPRARIRVVHNAVDTARFARDAGAGSAARRALGLADGTPVLIQVAQLTPWKGQQDAVRALSLLRGEGVDAHLLLVGSVKFASESTRYDNPAYVAAVRALARRLRLEERVHWLGEREDVPALLSAADVALAPSWEEPFGLAVAEALACELPVVATDRGGPAEIVTDGVEGLLVPPRDPQRLARAAGELLASPARRAEMGRAGRRRVLAAYGRSAFVARVLAAYREVVEGPETATGAGRRTSSAR